MLNHIKINSQRGNSVLTRSDRDGRTDFSAGEWAVGVDQIGPAQFRLGL